MSRTMNTGVRVLFPGENRWELRVFTGAESRVLETEEQARDLASKLNNHSQVAVPMNQIALLPLWLATDEYSLLEGMLELQLEKRGFLASRREETTRDYRVLQKEKGRTLVVASVLSRDFPEDWCFEQTDKYAPTINYIVLPKNRILLWRELGHLVVAFSAENGLIYAQTLQESWSVEELVSEILCTKLQLEAEQICPKLEEIVAWGSCNQNDLESLGKELSLPVQRHDDLPLHLPKKFCNLTPNLVRQFKKQQSKRHRESTIWIGVLLLYLFGIILFLGNNYWLLWQKYSLTKELALPREEAKVVQNTASRWNALELAILPENYPIEILYRCTRMLPDDGVRLIKFSQVGTRILMTGEAKNAPIVYKFMDDLKNSKDLSDYTWEMPPPKLLSNNSAQFQIEGKNKYVGSND